MTVLHVKMLTSVLFCMAKMHVTRELTASVKTSMDHINVFVKRDIFQPAMIRVIHVISQRHEISYLVLMKKHE